MRKILLTGWLLCTAAAIHAQNFVLKGRVQANPMPTEAQFIGGPGDILNKVEIDAKGNFTYTADVDKLTFGNLHIQGVCYQILPFVPNLKTEVSIDARNGDDAARVEFKGRMLEIYKAHIGVKLPQADGSQGFEAMTRQMQAHIDSVCQALQKLKMPDLTEAEMRRMKAAMQQAQSTYGVTLSEAGRDIKSDAAYNQYMQQMPIESLRDAMTYLMWYAGGTKAEPHWADMLAEAKRHITNTEVTDQLIRQLLPQIGNQVKDQQQLGSIYAAARNLASTPEMKAYVDKQKELNTRLGTGKPVIDTQLVAPDGQTTVQFADYVRGKVTYVDVWASWCGPCVAEIPHLAELVKEYQGNADLQVVSISIDSTEKPWLEKINKDKPAWAQYLCKTFASEYGINAIPRFLLIDRQGRIISMDAPRPSSGETIRKVINEALQAK